MKKFTRTYIRYGHYIRVEVKLTRKASWLDIVAIKLIEAGVWLLKFKSPPQDGGGESK